MKKFFKIFLLALLSCCYINTVFEFSENEKKTNFENETHFYIKQEYNLTQTFSKKAIQYLKNNLNYPLEFTISLIFTKFTYYSFTGEYFYPPPRRLYLLYSSLLYYD